MDDEDREEVLEEVPMNEYEMGPFRVQSPFDEQFTFRLLDDCVRRGKVKLRHERKQKAFRVGKEKRIRFEGRRYILLVTGNDVQIYPDDGKGRIADEGDDADML